MSINLLSFCLTRAGEFSDQVESKGLAVVATELSETVTDPKIQATEVSLFSTNIGEFLSFFSVYGICTEVREGGGGRG